MDGTLRLNMSNILFVITNPPETLTNARSTDAAPRACGKVSGRYPPPMTKKPPMPTIPVYLLTNMVVFGFQVGGELTRYSIGNTHQRRVQSGRHTPYGSIAYQGSKTESKSVTHEDRTSQLSQSQCGAHPSRHGCDFFRNFLERRQRNHLLFWLGGRLRCRSRRRGGARSRGQYLSVEGHNRPADDLVLQVNAERLLLRAHR